MKICVISTNIMTCPPAGYSGLEMIAFHQAAGLARRGHSVMLVAPVGSQPPDGVELHGTTLGESEQQSYSGYWQKLPEFSVVIDNSWSKWSYILKAEGKLKAPILGVIHAPPNTMYATPPPVPLPCIVAISRDQAFHVSEFWGVPARVAYNGMDPEFYKADPKIPKSGRYLFLARFSKIKGPHIAVDIARKLRFGLDLVGDDKITNEPDYAQRIMALAQNNIKYWGPVPREKCVEFFSSAKALLHMNQHYCHAPGQKIITDSGSIEIENIKEGMRVLSHDGKFHTVKHTMQRAYSGPILNIRHSSFCNSGRLRVTPDHLLYVIKPKACNEIKTMCRPNFHCYERCKILEGKAATYRAIMAAKGTGSIVSLAKRFGIPETTAHYWLSGMTSPMRIQAQKPIFDKFEPSWVEAKDLKTGDWVVTPVPHSVDTNVIPLWQDSLVKHDDGRLRATQNSKYAGKRGMGIPQSVECNSDFLSLCGWYIAEGFENHDGIRFALSIKEDKYANEIDQLCRRIFNRPVSIFKKPECNSQLCILQLSPIGKVFKSWFGGNTREKRMPQWMFELPPDKLRHVIASIWKGDGCVCKRGGHKIMTLTTASPTLAQQIWLALTKFGIVSYLVEKKQSKKSYSHGNIVYNLNVCGVHAQKLAEIVGWKIDRKRFHWKGITFIHKGFVFSKITKIESEQYNGQVYNMSVDGAQSYVAQLASSHNCEPFGMAPVESQMCGLPVIAFDNGAMRETIKHGETGFLVKTPEEVEQLIKTDAVASTKPEVCREWANQFSVQNMVIRYEELCKEALDTGGW